MSPARGRVLLPGVLLLAGCACALGIRPLRHQEDYFLREPGRVEFAFRRSFPDGGRIEGRLLLEIEEALWGSGPEGGYRLAGTMASELEGRLPSLDSAGHAPMEALREALPPEVFAEVFVPLALEIPGLSGEAWEVRWERARGLRLPLEYRVSRPPAPFTSELLGRSREWAIEAALVWLKLFFPLGLPALGSFRLVAVEENAEVALLRIEQELPGGRAIPLLVTLRRETGLHAVRADLGPDGLVELWREPR